MKKVGFVAFFMVWARVMGWQVPALHVRICQWLESAKADVRVIRIFRGAAKSTIYAIYKAWRLYRDPTCRSLVWSEDTKLAKKMTRDVLSILRRHPLCRGMLPQNIGAEEFWVLGAADARNASMAAYGVLSNATGSRADDVDFDDIEVPKNIRTAEAREKLRDRISEATHILVPGGRKTYIGTPHTHDTIYDEVIEGGGDVLHIPLFARHVRYDETTEQRAFLLPFKPEGLYVFVGIHKYAKLLTEGRDYEIAGKKIHLKAPTGGAVLDIYAGCAWPERFGRKDLLRRRKDTRTLNAWDSQYQLEAKPLHAIRLDPDRIRPYDVTPTIVHANGGVRMMLGRVQIVSATTYWDCALGKVDGDASVFSVILADDLGHLYLHVNEGLHGDLEVIDSRRRLVGGQCHRIVELVKQLQLPGVNVETNGVGGFVPAILRKHLPPGCGVREVQRTSGISKNRLILDALEAPLSAGFLWAHVDVINGPMWDQMKDWKADATSQPDDYLDAPAGAITQTPVRIGKRIGPPPQGIDSSWRAAHGTYETEFER